LAKAKTVFFCQECGYESSKWLGQCPGCHSWNSFVEMEAVSAAGPSGALRHGQGGRGTAAAAAVRLSEISLDEEEKKSTGIREFDRVLG